MEKGKALAPLKRYLFKVVLAPLLKLVEVAAELTTPFLTKFIIDKGINGDGGPDWNYVLMMGGIIMGLCFLSFFVTLLAQYLAARVSADYGYDLREKLFAHLNSLSEKELDTFGKQKALNIISNDCFSLQNGVMMFMRLLLRPPFLIIGAMVLSFIIDWRAGLIFLGVVLLSSAVLGTLMVLSPKRYAAIQSSLDTINTKASDTLKGSRPIRAFRKENYEKKEFNENISEYKEKSLVVGKMNAFVNPLTFCFVNLGMVLVVYLGGIKVNDGSLTTGSVVSLISYLTLCLNALVMFSRLIVSLNKAMASLKRINKFLDLEPSIVSPSESEDFKTGTPLLRFDDVSLSYSGAEPALSHISFSLNSGETLGLIGGTGSGKSSVLSLINRVYDPSEGTIEYRGADLKKIELESYREQIAYVSQKPSVFKGTIRSNLLLARPDASEEMMWKALSDALADEYVKRYEDGLDHVVEENGANLSGGQKQRLLIARAFLKEGSILILDDSMSALDFMSEKKLRHNIASKKGLTVIIVSQRATTLANCSKILVFDKGKIVDSGTHDELLKDCSIYQDIYEMQVAAR